MKSTLSPYKWTVRKKSGGVFKTWTVHDPQHICDDADQQWWFETFDEAIVFARREALREWFKQEFDAYIDDVQNSWMPRGEQRTGLDTMITYMRMYGKSWNLAEFMENL